MTWIEILDSETISAIRYDARHELLDIRFTNDASTATSVCPTSSTAPRLRADSKGRYFNEIVRDGYEYEELRNRLLGRDALPTYTVGGGARWKDLVRM